MNSKKQLFDLMSEKSELDFFLSSVTDKIVSAKSTSIKETNLNADKKQHNVITESILINGNINSTTTGVTKPEMEKKFLTVAESPKITHQEAKKVIKESDDAEIKKKNLSESIPAITEDKKIPVINKIIDKALQKNPISKILTFLKTRAFIWIIAGLLLILFAVAAIYMWL